MKLGKLLAAGKSIIGGREQIAYGVNKHIYLPKFGLAKNPFMSPAEVKPATAATETAAELAKKKITLLIAAKTQKLPTLSSTPSCAVSWVGKLNPVSLWRGSPEPDAQPSVQAELSLNGVKVVHNDLSDVDVEVVPMKSRPAQEIPVPVLAPAKKSWEVLGERLFKMEEVV
jgi:hypothetical protein